MSMYDSNNGKKLNYCKSKWHNSIKKYSTGTEFEVDLGILMMYDVYSDI